jgi:hypothetical protein
LGAGTDLSGPRSWAGPGPWLLGGGTRQLQVRRVMGPMGKKGHVGQAETLWVNVGDTSAVGCAKLSPVAFRRALEKLPSWW